MIGVISATGQRIFANILRIGDLTCRSIVLATFEVWDASISEIIAAIMANSCSDVISDLKSVFVVTIASDVEAYVEIGDQSP